MAESHHNEYVPDTVSPPGESLLETLEELGMSQTELVERTRRPYKNIREQLLNIQESYGDVILSDSAESIHEDRYGS